MDKIAVCIPCYNEEKTIGKVVKDFKAALPEAVVYVYDNNSADDTVSRAMAAGAVVRHEYSQGKGNVVRRMFMDVDALCYIIVDADDTYPAESARKMSDMIINGMAQMVVGDRLSSTYYTENKRRFHGFGNTLVRRLINTMFYGDIMDVMTGYRAVSYEFAKTFPVLSKGFEIETEMSIHALDKNMRICNVPVTYRDRQPGSTSKLCTYSDGIKVIGTIIRYCGVYRPLTFYGVISLILFFLAACFFLPVFISYMGTGTVDKFPTLITCGFAVMAAVQCFFTGVILHHVNKGNRQRFEIELIKASERKRELIGGVKDGK